MKARTRKVIALDAHADYGPSITLGSDGRMHSAGPGAVDLEDRSADPANDRGKVRGPVVRGARRRMALRNLWLDDAITKPMFDAANRFLDDCSLASGGSSASFLSMAMHGGTRDGMPEAQARAIRRVTVVRLMLGLNRDTVFWWVVIDNRTPKEFAETHRLRHATAYGWLRAALTALDEHYNPPGRARTQPLDNRERKAPSSSIARELSPAAA